MALLVGTPVGKLVNLVLLENNGRQKERCKTLGGNSEK
jgi:hypothetical protein